jgi:hypothetical protein
MRRRGRDADDAGMTIIATSADNVSAVRTRRLARRRVRRRWVGRAIAVSAVAGAIGVGTVPFGIGTSPVAPERVAISDGTSNT